MDKSEELRQWVSHAEENLSIAKHLCETYYFCINAKPFSVVMREILFSHSHLRKNFEFVVFFGI